VAEAPATETLLALPVETVAGRIARLLQDTLGARDVVVERVERTFGGNARRAWSFDAAWSGGAVESPLRGIMLSQVERAQVDADLTREFGVLRALDGTGVRAPAAIALDASGETIGAPSMILERCPGDANAVRLLRAADPTVPRELIRQLARIGARLHTVDWRATGMGALLDGAGLEPAAGARRQVEQWQDAFRDARMEPHPVLSAVYAWLIANLPTPSRTSVVHGDFRVGNFLHEDGRITGLLDWELAHLGDPVEDVAWAYRDFWSPARFLTLDAFVDEYQQAGGPPIAAAHLRYYRIFTEAKFATISLRGARAFHDGRTTNLRLADRAATVPESLTRCLRWIDETEGRGRA
jgi:aminoglycoside phosphotransferase (APT) family kinase protein